MKKNRTIIIGLDGVPYRLINDLADRGIMPSLGALMKKSYAGEMESSMPEISSVAWSSIITGKNPGEHGIFGFSDFAYGSYRMCFPNYNDLKSPPFWEQTDGKSVIINVPSTFPARKMNGVHIAGFVALDLDRAVWPQSVLPRLRELDYRIDVDASKAHQSTDLFLADLKRTNSARINTCRYLWDHKEWTTFMMVFTGTDRLMHFLWDAYEDAGHRYHHEFLDYFSAIDEYIGNILNDISEDDLFIMLSDHGFERLDYDVNINYLLAKNHYLAIENVSAPWSSFSEETVAFALDPGRIYLHCKDRFPRGNVRADDRERIIRNLEELLYPLEMDGRRVIKKIYRKEELYSGPSFDAAPDLVLHGASGFNLRARMDAVDLFGRDIFTGKHTYDDAFLLVRSNQKIQCERKPTVYDVAGIINGKKNIA